MDILKTLQAINAGHGPSGDESGVAGVIESIARPYADEISRDVMGNLIVRKKGSGPRIMFAAHMDCIGFVVSYIEDNGRIRFGRLGGLNANSCLYSTVRFKNGLKGIIAIDEDADSKKPDIADMYIDIGASSKEEAEKQVALGDTAVCDYVAFAAGDKLVSPYLDNRISCVALLLAMERMTKNTNDVYFVFTVQEEIGCRGAKTSAYTIDPKYGVAVDITIGDSKKVASSVLGGGAAIKIMDRSIICHPQVIKKMEELAREQGIASQMDVLRAGGTDGGRIHVSRGGVYTGGISVPCRNVHTTVEMVAFKDVDATADLIRAFAEADLD